ncbi:hypothetical protein D9V32_03780 [Mycetocola tolaasinivorans]|uniref:Uncharacterized protein n=1 Tax=Mycetocola tolaasinivorans TaxID=76635 RepID=A0A3L7ABM1_9MICO|nr:hypothetical protein D9V32_03780 [Mycetocola tolaasinivorans]
MLRSVEVDETGNVVSSSVEPQRNWTTCADDGTVHFLLTVAAPVPGQDAEGLPTPGTVIAEETLALGECVSTL